MKLFTLLMLKSLWRIQILESTSMDAPNECRNECRMSQINGIRSLIQNLTGSWKLAEKGIQIWTSIRYLIHVPTRKMDFLFGWRVFLGQNPVWNQPWNIIEIAICINKVNGTIHLALLKSLWRIQILVEDSNPWIYK